MNISSVIRCVAGALIIKLTQVSGMQDQLIHQKVSLNWPVVGGHVTKLRQA